MNPRHDYARRLRALEGRIERLRTAGDVVRLWAEWSALQEWWAHATDNHEALAVLRTARVNIAWERCRRRLVRARRARQDGRPADATRLWREGREMLRHDWRVMYRREPIPDVGNIEWPRGP